MRALLVAVIFVLCGIGAAIDDSDRDAIFSLIETYEGLGRLEGFNNMLENDIRHGIATSADRAVMIEVYNENVDSYNLLVDQTNLFMSLVFGDVVPTGLILRPMSYWES